MAKTGLRLFWMILFFLGIVLLFRWLAGGNEDSWICVNGQWVKHGQPSSDPPLTGCGDDQPVEAVPTQKDRLIGGDKDEGGCLIGAGYSWCEAKQKCLRVWEEPCE